MCYTFSFQNSSLFCFVPYLIWLSDSFSALLMLAFFGCQPRLVFSFLNPRGTAVISHPPFLLQPCRHAASRNQRCPRHPMSHQNYQYQGIADTPWPSRSRGSSARQTPSLHNRDHSATSTTASRPHKHSDPQVKYASQNKKLTR
ncbi:hypothetical protein ASPFODRAFT_587232 [Aspergillus luchuensis CBS 106.47]|uniref:Uncharacterized protein n=1 Tax=Aspergillus luchuensis (strain CBS 106.47) TaxID=1137211 RepID=A0A1M3TM46_ASPLC|nr:hypothetical protein ASPFODRAFT_587232 [Aspergillus luchuensis CBS 106.47]